jgi:purine-binding chemotaxis protein CheW
MANESTVNKGTRQRARELQVVLSGSRYLGILVDDIETIADWRPPTPLPQAPPGILGIVCIRGRMLTVLDANVLFGRGATDQRRITKIVALPGDEQVALAVEEIAEIITVNEDELPSPARDALVIAEIAAGDRSISVLNTKELFATAMRGHERRRRQF